jgi:hypothetical protein
MLAGWKTLGIQNNSFIIYIGRRRTRRMRRRRPGRPLKRLPDGYTREAKGGHLLA